jgi:predicted DNA-binding transcriptional regulator YafY
VLETSARLLRLLSLLQARADWSGADLAARLEITPRTVRRDVERLRDLGYPVHATSGPAGGYRLGAGAALPPLLLEDEEAVAVAVGLRTAAAGAVTGIEEASLRALAKLEQVLPARLRRQVNALQTSTVPLPLPEPGPTVDPAVLTTLATACRDHLRLRFDYRTHDGTSTRRTAEPHRLVAWGRRWYLVAWDAGRADWRTFRADRISPLPPPGPRFSPRPFPGGDVAAFVARGISAASWRYAARVRVHAPAAAVRERINHFVGTVEALDDETSRLLTGADSLDTLAVYLGMLGFDFAVDSPPELVEHIRALGERYRRAAP